MNTLESELAGIEQMLTGVSEGPWNWDDDVPTEFVRDYYKERAPFLMREGSYTPVLSGEMAAKNNADVHFIAASRTLIPTLVNALRTAVEQRNDFIGANPKEREICDADLASIFADGREGR